MTTKDTIYITIILVLVFINVKTGDKTNNDTYTLRLEKESERFKGLYKEKKQEADSLIIIADSLKSLKPKQVIKYRTVRERVLEVHTDTLIIDFVAQCDSMNTLNDSIITSQDNIIQAQIDAIAYADTTIMYKDSVITSQKSDIRDYRKRIIKEKKAKRLVGAGGVVGIILAIIFL